MDNGKKKISTSFKADAKHFCKMDKLLIKKKDAEANYVQIRDWVFDKIPRAFSKFRKCKDFEKGKVCESGSLINCQFYHYEEEKDIWVATYEEKRFNLKNFMSTLREKKQSKVKINVDYFEHQFPGKFLRICKDCFSSDPKIISQKLEKNCQHCHKVCYLKYS